MVECEKIDLEEKIVYIAKCPICRSDFTGSSKAEAIREVKDHAELAHDKKAKTIRVRRMRHLGDILGKS